MSLLSGILLAASAVAVVTADTGQDFRPRPDGPAPRTPATAMAQAKAVVYVPADQCTVHPGVKWIPSAAPCWQCDPAWWDVNRPARYGDQPAWREDGVDIETVVRANLVDGLVL